jgi:uncharacterized protein (TIGR03000 family)
MRRIPPLVALVLGLTAVSARGQSTVTEGNIPVPPPSNSWSDSYRPVSGGPAPAAVYAPAPAAVYVPVYVSAPAPAAAPATVVVRLPADARLTIDGDATVSAGAARLFASPPLAAGRTFYYTLSAEVVRDGRRLTVTHRVAVRAGQESAVELVPAAFSVAGK